MGQSLAPRIARMYEQTLYKPDPSRPYAQLDPLLDGTIGVPHNAVVAWNIKRVGQLVEQLRAEGHVRGRA